MILVGDAAHVVGEERGILLTVDFVAFLQTCFEMVVSWLHSLYLNAVCELWRQIPCLKGIVNNSCDGAKKAHTSEPDI